MVDLKNTGGHIVGSGINIYILQNNPIYSGYFHPLQNLPFISPSPLAHRQWDSSNDMKSRQITYSERSIYNIINHL